MKNKLLFITIVLVLIASLLLTACQPATTEEPVEEQAEEQVEEIVPTEEPSKVGGRLVYAFAAEPDTLDMQKTANGFSDEVCSFVGGSLVLKVPETGELVPSMAKSWEVSEDGLTYTFYLKEGIKFHDGTSFTAEDYAFTINRALDPATASPGTAGMIAGAENAAAVDDLTLVIHMAAPNALLMENLALPGYLMPFSKAYVEAHDDEYLGRNPMSVGPYIFKEWVTGEHIIVERNPEYTWGPDYGPGPYNIETIEFRFIPDETTILSGLEAGELDLVYSTTPTFVDQLQGNENFQMIETLDFSIMSVLMNMNVPPLDQMKMRQAINYALDRPAIIDLILNGRGIPANGPFSPAVYGYNEILDTEGFSFDPGKAKALLEELGYTLNADGIYEKEGETLSFTINTMDETETITKLAEVIQQQLKDAGIEVEIQVMEFGMAIGALMGLNFELSIMNYGMPNASILNLIYGEQSIGAGIFMNAENVQTMFDTVSGVATIIDPDAWIDNVKEAQRLIIIDMALVAPVYVEKGFVFINKDFADAKVGIDTQLYLHNAYYIGE